MSWKVKGEHKEPINEEMLTSYTTRMSSIKAQLTTAHKDLIDTVHLAKCIGIDERTLEQLYARERDLNLTKNGLPEVRYTRPQRVIQIDHLKLNQKGDNNESTTNRSGGSEQLPTSTTEDVF